MIDYDEMVVLREAGSTGRHKTTTNRKQERKKEERKKGRKKRRKKGRKRYCRMMLTQDKYDRLR